MQIMAFLLWSRQVFQNVLRSSGCQFPTLRAPCAAVGGIIWLAWPMGPTLRLHWWASPKACQLATVVCVPKFAFNTGMQFAPCPQITIKGKNSTRLSRISLLLDSNLIQLCAKAITRSIGCRRQPASYECCLLKPPLSHAYTRNFGSRCLISTVHVAAAHVELGC